MEDRFGHRISYLRVSVTDRCNERCVYCMPQELQEWLPHSEILTYQEIQRLVRVASELGVRKLRITGGEPLTRRNVLELFREISALPKIQEIGVSTNGSLLAKEVSPGVTMAQALRELRVTSLNVSLDTLQADTYAAITGRDFLSQTLAGLQAAKHAGFTNIRLNTVLMRGRNENELTGIVRFARLHQFLVRFIELMPVSTESVLNDENFLPVAEAKRIIESEFGPLIPDPQYRTNGPAVYYQCPGYQQRIGFIGALTNLHFCDTCNKLRLTCEGKLRPCLGSHLEFDIKKPLRAGASDEELQQFFRQVVDQKPEMHEFRSNYRPGRKMVAIGG
jgi:GTP 3',8-cyclase